MLLQGFLVSYNVLLFNHKTFKSMEVNGKMTICYYALWPCVSNLIKRKLFQNQINSLPQIPTFNGPEKEVI